jgi:hypothetical protein
MKFDEIIIIDWYDNIINAFCKNTDDTYYCSLLALDMISDEKIYVCISIKFFKHYKEISEIIKSNNLKDNWERFYNILNLVNPKNQSYLIKTKDLKGNSFEVVKYKDNFNWDAVLFDDYPEVLDKTSSKDNWWQYW